MVSRGTIQRFILLALAWLPAGLARTEDWPQWRGPNRDGVWSETGIIEAFPPGGLKAAWRAPVGEGFSSPVVAAGSVYVTDAELVRPKARERVHAFDAATGKERWTHAYDVDYPDWAFDEKSKKGPVSTPIVEGGRLYALGGLGLIHCLEVEKGGVIWKRDLGKEFPADEIQTSACPLIEGDHLIIHSGGKHGVCVIALDKKSGEEAWRALEERPAFSSPIAITAGGKRQVIVWTDESVTSLDPVSGKTWWRLPLNATAEYVISTPVAHDDLLLLGGLMLKLDAGGAAPSVLWPAKSTVSRRILSHTSTPLLLSDHIYSAKSSGELICLEAKTGKQVWSTDKVTELRNGASIHLTPQGGSVLLYTERGELIRARLTPAGYEEVSRTALIRPTYPYGGRKCAWAPPAFADRRVFVRSDEEIVCASLAAGDVGTEPLGLFEGRTDVGAPRRAGYLRHDPAENRYAVTGGGSNMWFARDSFHFVWKRVSGDLSLAADIAFEGTGGEPHRKACLMVRQSLDGDSAYADAALHGDGLTSLQYREAKGAPTREIQSNVKGPRRLLLEKRGRYASMSVQRAGGELEPAGGSFRLQLEDPFYVGLAVCAHYDERLETAVFSNVELTLELPSRARPALLSTLERVAIASKDRRVVWSTRERIEAPNWSRDGKELFFNREGRIYRIPAAGGEPRALETGPLTRLNNDHGLSPDGARIALSDQSRSDRLSRIYTMPLAGGPPVLLTEEGPSYWHGWSPDGLTLVYCAERKGEFDIYAVPARGGPERRLTESKGLDDGPDYSPDGRFIYFNSERTGRMQIWRMKADGSDQEQVTSGVEPSWFPHPSPDGKWIVFLSYEAGVEGHPEDRDVMLRLMPAGGGPVEALAKLLGGQGTLNVPSWSPDSREVAFVSYQTTR